MTVFDTALDAIFADANLCVDALWKAGGAGAGVTVRAARYRPGDTSAFNGGHIVTNGERIEVRQSEVPALAAGDTFEIASVTWRVMGDPVRQDDARTWIATIAAA